jgi:hypothetical protein
VFYSRLLAGLRVPFLVGQRDRYASWRCACRELRYRRLIIAFIFMRQISLQDLPR